MMVVVTFEHPPELCLARAEYEAEGMRWIETMAERAKQLGITIHGAYVSTIEHTFYFVLEIDRVAAMAEFFRPPILTHHKARISPVINLQEAKNLTFIPEAR